MMKKILMAAAIGLLFGAVCMADVKVQPGDGQLEVIWDAVPGANGYEVWYTTDPAEEGQQLRDISGTSGIIRTLENGVRYYVSVYAMNGTGGAIAELKGDGIPGSQASDTDQILAEIAATDGRIASLTQSINTVSGRVDALTDAVKRGNAEATKRATDAEKARLDALTRAQAAEKATREALLEVQRARDDAAIANARAEYTDNRLNDLLSKEGLPLWVTDGDELNKVLEQAKLEGVFVGIGSATNKKDYQAIQMAEARARQDLAFQLDAQIKAEITDYAKNLEGEKGEQESSSSASEEYMIMQQSVDTRLRSAEVVKRQKVTGSGPNDPHTWWVVITTGKPKGQIDVNGNPIPVTSEPVKTKGAYETLEAPDAVKQMDEHLEAIILKDERVGRNTLRPTVDAAVIE